jgi:hypothetical protein
MLLQNLELRKMRCSESTYQGWKDNQVLGMSKFTQGKFAQICAAGMRGVVWFVHDTDMKITTLNAIPNNSTSLCLAWLPIQKSQEECP